MKWKRILKWSALAILVILFSWFEFVYWTSTNNCGRSIPSGAECMKAIRYCEYGSPDDVMKLEEVEKPTPNDNQILVRVRAVSLRFFDGGMLQGGVGRLVFGLRKPKNTILGSDFAGSVEAVGANVTEFKPGDEVFGVRAGCLAQYVCVRRDGAIVSKPSNLSFEQAASVPTALVALQGLRDTGNVKPGHKVLINGASGGVGTMAVQIARALGAEVTGVCSTGNVELIRSLGAERVIDYTHEDFTDSRERYDVILDNVMNHSPKAAARLLAPNGVLIPNSLGNTGGLLASLPRMAQAALLGKGATNVKFVTCAVNRENLNALARLLETNHVRVVIERTYALKEAAS